MLAIEKLRAECRACEQSNLAPVVEVAGCGVKKRQAVMSILSICAAHVCDLRIGGKCFC